MSIKLLAAAAVVAASTASVAQANSYFSFITDHDQASTIDLGTVVAASNGTVEIYNYQAGEQRELLGMTDVFAGANGDVRVSVGPVQPRWDVLAVLKVGGEVVDTQVIDINR